MMPRAGGQYVYLREAFSPLWGFLYGWTLFLVIQTGTIAAVAVAFARFLGVLWPAIAGIELPDPARAPLDRLRRIALDGAARRLRPDRAADVDQHARARVRQVHPERLHDGEDRRAGRADRDRSRGRAGTPAPSRPTSAISGRRAARSRSRRASPRVTAFGLFVAMCVAQTGSLFSSDAWNNITFTAGEVKNPRRNAPAFARARHRHRHRPVPARERRLPGDAAVRRDPERAGRSRRHGDARRDLPRAGRHADGRRHHHLDVRLRATA